MTEKKPGLRLATYNVEWFNALFDNNGRMLDDAEPSTRYKTTRGEQLAALAIVFTALDADGITIIEAPDTNGHRSTVKALEFRPLRRPARPQGDHRLPIGNRTGNRLPLRPRPPDRPP